MSDAIHNALIGVGYVQQIGEQLGEAFIRGAVRETQKQQQIDDSATDLAAENAHLKLLLLAGLHTAGEETRSDGNGRVSLAHAEEVTVPPEALKHPAARGLSEWVEACCEVFRADLRKTTGLAK